VDEAPDLSSDVQTFRDAVRDLLTATVDSTAMRSWASDSSTAAKLWADLSNLGIFQAITPVEYGGLGFGLGHLTPVIEELGRALVPPIVVSSLIFGELLGRYGSAATQTALFPRFAEGEIRVALAIEAPRRSNSSVAAVKATQTGESWAASGSVPLAPGGVGEDMVVVAALPTGSDRAALLLCRADSPGLSLRGQRTLDETTGLSLWTFDDVAAEDVWSTPSGLSPHETLMSIGAVTSSAELVGVAGAAFDMSLDYVKHRSQFDRPIGSFQAVKHIFADMYLGLEMSRTVAHSVGRGFGNDSDTAMQASISKAFVANACRRVVYDSLQMLGGIGFTWEHDFHLFLRRSKYLEQSFGSVEWHREHVASLAIESRRRARTVA
jgi:alkylation response protein AidB-like acyl-CoA dehydrogenase